MQSANIFFTHTDPRTGQQFRGQAQIELQKFNEDYEGGCMDWAVFLIEVKNDLGLTVYEAPGFVRFITAAQIAEMKTSALDAFQEKFPSLETAGEADSDFTAAPWPSGETMFSTDELRADEAVSLSKSYDACLY